MRSDGRHAVRGCTTGPILRSCVHRYTGGPGPTDPRLDTASTISLMTSQRTRRMSVVDSDLRGFGAESKSSRSAGSCVGWLIPLNDLRRIIAIIVMSRRMRGREKRDEIIISCSEFDLTISSLDMYLTVG